MFHRHDWQIAHLSLDHQTQGRGVLKRVCRTCQAVLYDHFPVDDYRCDIGMFPDDPLSPDNGIRIFPSPEFTTDGAIVPPEFSA